MPTDPKRLFFERNRKRKSGDKPIFSMSCGSIRDFEQQVQRSKSPRRVPKYAVHVSLDGRKWTHVGDFKGNADSVYKSKAAFPSPRRRANSASFFREIGAGKGSTSTHVHVLKPFIVFIKGAPRDVV